MDKKEFCRKIVDFVLELNERLRVVPQEIEKTMRDDFEIETPKEIRAMMEDRLRDAIAEKLAQALFPAKEE